MRLKSIVKYNLYEMKTSVLTFYSVMLLIVILFTIYVSSISGMDNHSKLSGLEMSSAIFLFVVGICFFKQNYLFLSTNGAARKSHFIGFIISSAIVAAIMAAIDTTCGNIIPQFGNYKSLFEQVYSSFIKTSPGFVTILTNFACNMSMYLLMLALGYFIRTLYYRMSGLLKIVVSVGVPALYSVILPILDLKVSNGMIGRRIVEFFKTIAGLNGIRNPYAGIMFEIVCTVILLCLAFLLVRRAPLKE